MSLDRAINEVTKVVNTYKCAKDLLDALESAKGWETVEKETKARIDKLKEQEASLAETVNSALREAQDYKDIAAKELEQATHRAKQIVAEADETASAMIDKAKTERDETGRLEDAAKARLSALEELELAKAGELKATEDKLAQIKAKIAEIAGA